MYFKFNHTEENLTQPSLH